MSRLNWDATGERFYETGLSKGVLYPQDKTGEYGAGVPWNGLTAVNETPSGAEPTDLWADDIKYASLRSAENFGATVEAYTYPPEFGVCDGTSEISPGVEIGQQDRLPFGMSYCSKIGNDVSADAGYKIHIIYGATANPSERSRQTINDSPEAITMSWELNCVPVSVTGFKPTAHLVIDSTKADAAKLKTLEDKLYGSEDEEPTILMPDEIAAIFKTA